METRKNIILGLIGDYVLDILYYDRKDDSILLRGDIEEAVQAGEISLADMVERFRECLSEGLQEWERNAHRREADREAAP